MKIIFTMSSATVQSGLAYIDFAKDSTQLRLGKQVSHFKMFSENMPIFKDSQYAEDTYIRIATYLTSTDAIYGNGQRDAVAKTLFSSQGQTQDYYIRQTVGGTATTPTKSAGLYRNASMVAPDYAIAGTGAEVTALSGRYTTGAYVGNYRYLYEYIDSDFEYTFDANTPILIYNTISATQIIDRMTIYFDSDGQSTQAQREAWLNDFIGQFKVIIEVW